MGSQLLTPEALDRLLAARQMSLETLEIAPPARSSLFELFIALSGDVRDQLMTEHTYQPGEIVFAEGDGGDALYLISSGQVAVLKGDFETPTILGYRGSGEIIGEMALLEDQPRSASVVALHEVSLLCVRRDDFAQLLNSNPSLAMSIMSTLSARLRASDHVRTVQTHVEEQLTHELESAGEVQARFLPDAMPDVPGWEIAAGLLPVWQTTGDFYDFIELETGHLGLLIADVTDKGTSAALFMALSRTLIRTYAMQYPTGPARAFRAANERILSDTRSDQFVTTFYAVLDPRSGTLVYANAGHNPPLLFRAGADTPPLELPKTGIPLGMFAEATWEQCSVQMGPGDMLVAYTDGVSDARNTRGQEFGTQRLVDAAQALLGQPAQHVQAALMAAVQAFVGHAPPFDDMTLLVAVRT